MDKEIQKLITSLLALIFGTFGVHRFYLRDWKGILYVLFCWTGLPTIISFIESLWWLMMDDDEWYHRYITNLRDKNKK